MLDLIEETNRMEQEIEKSTTYTDCFRGSNLRRTEICTVVYLTQVIGGNPLIGYANYFFELAGLSPANAFIMGVGNTALGFVGTCLPWLLLHKFGRRFTYNNGMIVMTVMLFIIGFLDLGAHESGQSWAQATIMDLWTFTYQTTVGPVAFTIMAEISSTRLRGRTIAIATAVQAFASIVFTIAIPYMLNANEANWRGKTGFFFGGISVFCYIWCFFRIPESKGRTFEELNILFDKRVPARAFANYNVDLAEFE